MHRDHELIRRRIERILAEWLRPAVHSHRTPLAIELGPVSAEPIAAADAIAGGYRPFAAGSAWGAPWHTCWFRLRGEVPPSWPGPVEAVIDLGFERAWPGKQAEGLVYEPDGTPVKGIAPRNRHVPVGGGAVELYLEAVANPELFTTGWTPTRLGDLHTAGTEPLYRFASADLAVLDTEVFGLVLDLAVLLELAAELDPDRSRAAEIHTALAAAADRLDRTDLPGTAAAARAALTGVLSAPAHASAHRVHAVGHAHIDSAWLWPLRETVRKASRTFANVTHLAEHYPDLVFVASQAQQYDWVERHQPAIFARIKAAVARGTWVPVGGMWVESDATLPSGESLVRQFLYGSRYFADRFGVQPEGVWLPDSFGYTAALPQIAALAGMKWFLSQKMSWNATNRFPHHTFQWEGLDGTRILTHFPPVDTYNATLTAGELAHAERNYAEKGHGRRSLVPFGYGDGGGGPTREMVERARRLRDLEGSPRVEITDPGTFFALAAAESTDPPVWRGELYLETHRGTYTSQHLMKAGNRCAERLLRSAELWCTAALLHAGLSYPYSRLAECWKTALLHQFHDILPGSSIAWVHREARDTYERLGAELESVIADALAALGSGSTVAHNASPFPRAEVVSATSWADVPALGAGVVRSDPPFAPVRVTTAGGNTVLDNGLVRVTLDGRGLVTSVVEGGRELLAGPANLLRLHPDHPADYDAWDLDSHYRNTGVDLIEVESLTVRTDGPLLASVDVLRRFGASRVTQTVTVRAGSRRIDLDTRVDWHEREKVLKLVFPLDIHAEEERAEVQFGHVRRPTHGNTSWDAARFERYAHRWIHVGEHGYGAALLTDSTYGYDIDRTPTETGTATTVRPTLLRAPISPDPDTDQGEHVLSYALLPGASVQDAVAESHAFTNPLVPRPGRAVPSLVDAPGVVVDTVKPAEDRSGDIIVRLYEALGGRASTTLVTGFPCASAGMVDLLERPLDELEVVDGGIVLVFRPFEIKTVRCVRAPRCAPGETPAGW